MTATDLDNLCRPVYGDAWQTQLARDTGVHPGVIDRWMGGKGEISTRIAAMIRRTVAARLEQAE